MTDQSKRLESLKEAMNDFKSSKSIALLAFFKEVRNEYHECYLNNNDEKWPFWFYFALLLDKMINCAFNCRPLYMNDEDISAFTSIISTRVLAIIEANRKNIDSPAKENILFALSELINFTVNFHHVSYDKYLLLKIHSMQEHAEHNMAECFNSMCSWFGTIDEWAFLYSPRIIDAISRHFLETCRKWNGKTIRLVNHDLAGTAITSRMVSLLREEEMDKFQIHFIRDNRKVQPDIHKGDMRDSVFFLIAGTLKYTSSLHLPIEHLMDEVNEKGIAGEFIHVGIAFDCRDHGKFHNGLDRIPSDHVHTFFTCNQKSGMRNTCLREPTKDRVSPLEAGYLKEEAMFNYVASKINGKTS